MNSVQMIDVKGLEHKEREERIFPSLDNLKERESLKIILEFNPVPLVYLLNARNEFETSFDKEGPDEWILNIKRIAERKNRKEDFKALLAEMRGGQVSKGTREKAKEFFRSVDAKTIADLEQEVIREGVSHEEVRKHLCDVHLEAIRDILVEKRIMVSSPHPVYTFMEEHKIIQENLKELGALVDRLKGKGSYESLGEDKKILKDIALHLIEAESHHQREEDILFPVLESHGIEEPPKIMKMDHIEFRERKKELFQLAHKHEDYPFEQFKDRVIELGEYLSQELDSHIFKEDNILYQIALQVLNEKEWEKVKRECDKIGYCCFSPEDVAQEGNLTELDLRPMPPPERHKNIFKTWEKLAPGKAMRIINDHDPKPLYYQFEAEEKGNFEWQYEKEGPEDWIVRIKRI